MLCVGDFVQFNDVGSEVWNLPLGYLAAVLAIVSVVVAVSQPQARLWLGVAMALLLAFLVWQSIANSVFRFVWGSGEYEFLLFLVGFGVLTFALIATGLQPARKAGTRSGAGRWMVRVVVYLAVIALAAWIIGMLAAGYYERTQCAGMEDDCLAVLGGLVWGLGTVAAGVVTAVVIEVVLLSRRRQRAQ